MPCAPIRKGSYRTENAFAGNRRNPAKQEVATPEVHVGPPGLFLRGEKVDFNEYQKQAIKFATYPNVGSNLIYPALGLANEAGEAAGKIKHFWRDRGIDDGDHLTSEEKKELAKEIGDVLWYCAALADEAYLDLDDVAKMNIEKLASRKERGTLLGEGDNR